MAEKIMSDESSLYLALTMDYSWTLISTEFLIDNSPQIFSKFEKIAINFLKLLKVPPNIFYTQKIYRLGQIIGI
jgi:hypothetical protein